MIDCVDFCTIAADYRGRKVVIEPGLDDLAFECPTVLLGSYRSSPPARGSPHVYVNHTQVHEHLPCLARKGCDVRCDYENPQSRL